MFLSKNMCYLLHGNNGFHSSEIDDFIKFKFFQILYFENILRQSNWQQRQEQNKQANKQTKTATIILSILFFDHCQTVN